MGRSTSQITEVAAPNTHVQTRGVMEGLRSIAQFVLLEF